MQFQFLPLKPNMLDPQTNNHPFLFNPEKTSDASYESYDTWQPMNYSSRAQRTAQNYKSWKSMGALRLNAAEEEFPSGVCSPPLWKTTTNSPPRSPNRVVSNYRSLSPSSRTQAIARGQREMMEMVRNMPESCYELSLKDLVERPRMVEVEVDEVDASTEALVKKQKNERKKPMVMRSGSMDSGGFLLKMVFPISLGANKKNNKVVMMNKNKKNKSDAVVGHSSTSDKVSAKPCVDKDWWKKRVSASGGSGISESCASSIISGSIKSSSGSGSSSSSSSCSSRSSSRRKSTRSCWSFIVLRKKRQG